MDEFIENFNKFREWLYRQPTLCSDNHEAALFDLVIEKFEELELDKAF